MSRLSLPHDDVVVLTAASWLTEDAHGKTFILNSGTEFVTYLPPYRAGLKLTFIVGAAPSSASYTIEPNDGADTVHGVVVSAEDAAGAGDSTGGTGTDLITIVDGKAKVGDRLDLVCDGARWFAIAYVTEQDAITYS